MKHAGEGDKVDVLSGDVQLGGLPDGVTVTNSGAGDVTVNGNPVTTDPVVSHTHAWGEPVWAWAADHSGATATFTCTKDSSHQEIVAATIGSETEAASCTADGKTVYTATAVFGGKTYTDVQTVTIPAKHQFKDGVCAVCGAPIPPMMRTFPDGRRGQPGLWTSLLLLGGMAAVGIGLLPAEEGCAITRIDMIRKNGSIWSRFFVLSLGAAGARRPSGGGFPDGLTRREEAGTLRIRWFSEPRKGQGQISPFPQKGPSTTTSNRARSARRWDPLLPAAPPGYSRYRRQAHSPFPGGPA